VIPLAPAPLVAVRDLRRVYGTGDAIVQALAGVSLDVGRGEFVALMGASGSGKSTLLNSVGALDMPTSGSYLYRGVEVTTLSHQERALLRREYFGYIFQGFHLLPRSTALENVELPLVYRGVPAAERRRRATEALESVGLGHRMDHLPNELSGGQQQRVAIARALVTQPDLLLADEPTGNLDSATSHEVMGLLTRLHQDRGITILMVTHEPDMAAYIPRIVTFADGHIASDRRAA